MELHPSQPLPGAYFLSTATLQTTRNLTNGIPGVPHKLPMEWNWLETCFSPVSSISTQSTRKGALRGEDCSVWYLSHCSLLIFAMRAASSRPRSCETEGRGSESRATWVQCEHLEASNGSLVFLGFLLVSFQNPPNGVLGFTETKKKNEETRICQVQALGTLPGLDQGPLV